MNEMAIFRNNIAASIFLQPCSEEELCTRDFLKNYSLYGIQRMIMQLEKNAIFYRGEVMHIYKKWAMKNLGEYDLNFNYVGKQHWYSESVKHES